MYRLPLGEGVRPALDRLAAELPASEFRDATLAWLERHYRPEATVAGSFGGALAELLGTTGDPRVSTAPTRRAKRAAAPRLVNALRQAAELDADLDTGPRPWGVTARNSGHHRRRWRHAGDARGRAGTRSPGASDGAAFVTRRSRERFDLAAIQRIAAREPTRLSPNVLLRPVVESAVLPTVAYVGGPGELRYLALTPPVYDRLGVRPAAAAAPVVGRRRGAPGRAGPGEVRRPAGRPARPGGRARGRMVRVAAAGEATSTRSPAASGARRGVRAASSARRPKSIRRWRRRCRAARQQALGGTEEIEKKLVQHLKKRQETELGQVARARTAVLPERQAAGAGLHRGAVPGAIWAGAPRRCWPTRSVRGMPAPLKGPSQPLLDSTQCPSSPSCSSWR